MHYPKRDGIRGAILRKRKVYLQRHMIQTLLLCNYFDTLLLHKSNILHIYCDGMPFSGAYMLHYCAPHWPRVQA